MNVTGLIKSQLIKDSFWALVGTVVSKVLSLSGLIIIARMLGSSIYGEYGIVKSTLLSFAFLATIGLGYTATKYIAELVEGTPEAYTKVIIAVTRLTWALTVIALIILLLTVNLIAERLLDNPELSVALLITAPFFVFNAMVMVQNGIISGLGKFKALAKINSIAGFIMFIAGVALTYYFGLYGALSALVIVQLVQCYLNHVLIRSCMDQHTKLGIKDPIYKELLRFTFPVALQEMLYSLTSWILGLILINFSTYSEVGLYNAAIQWNAIILFIPAILRNVILTHMSKVNSDKTKHTKILRAILLLNFSVTFVVALVVYLLSDFIASFYGDTYSGLSKVISIAVFTTIMISMSNVYSQAYMSINKNWTMLMFRTVRDLGILILAYALINQANGTEGAKVAFTGILIANTFFLILMAAYYEWKLKDRSTN